MATRFKEMAGIVTGGSSGIGQAVVERLCDEGASVGVVAAQEDRGDLDALARQLRARGHQVSTVVGDIADERTVEDAVAAVLEYNRVDFVINNAGFAYREPVLATPVDHLERLF